MTPQQPGDSVGPIRHSPIAGATASEAKAVLTPGVTYTGRVVARQGDGTYTVAVTKPAVELQGVQLAFPVLGGLAGLQIHCNLPQLTGVKLVYDDTSFIFAVLPDNNKDWLNAKTRSITWGDGMDGEVGVTENQYSDHSEDLIEGEVEFSNLYGVSMAFLTTIMRMNAGDRAAVECHLINDMVRVISSQYRHISGIGDDLIFDHGRPTRERSWSSYRHEVLGSLLENEPLIDLNGDEVDREKAEADRVARVGRHRFREFVGFAGDFIHSFVTDPPAAMLSLAAPNDMASGAGKSWFHRNSDGSLIAQSIADIRIERVVRIPVPIRYKSHEDQTTTRDRHYDELEKQFLKLPKVATPTDPKNAFLAAYHLRSYSRWMSRFHSFARMLQLSGEYKLPSEAASPVPDLNNGEGDRQDENAGVEYYEAYACMCIYRDGSIVNHDGYGSAVVMSNGNLQLSAARHFDIEAAGDIRMIAGGSIILKAMRNIEIVATFGSFIATGYASFKALCEKGTLWLRSNAVTKKDVVPVAAIEDNTPIPEIAGWEEDVSDGHGILIESAAGTATFRSERAMSIGVDGAPVDEDDTDFDLVIAARRASLDLSGGRAANLHSQQSVLLSSGNLIAIHSNTFLSNASRVLFGPDLDSPQMSVISGSLYCQSISSLTLRSNSITGPEIGPVIPIPDLQNNVTLKRHFGHIRTLTSDVEAPDGASEKEKERMEKARELANTPPNLPWSGSFDGPRWAFSDPDEYAWDTRESGIGGIPETITQQYLRLDAEADTDFWGGNGYDIWNLETSISGPRTRAQGGFGSHELQLIANDEGENLHEPSATDPSAMTEVTPTWQPKDAYAMKVLKRPE